MENQGYKSINKVNKPNKKQRAAAQKLREQKKERVLGAIDPRSNKVLVPVENIPGNRPANPERVKPRIINIETPKKRIPYFRQGRRLDPPTSCDKRDQLLCNKCKKRYENRYCINCVKIKLGFKSDSAPSNKTLNYIPLTDGFIDPNINSQIN